ncbi:MAG TPA: hypothetical protein VF298_02035 [Bacteroidales bacterium]
MISRSSLLSWYDSGKPTERRIAVALILASFLLLVVLTWLSNGVYTGGDNINHYHIAHYSWKYPHLLLDHWGKPLFTLFSSPFAYFGFFGARMFNILAGITAAWLAYLTMSRIGYRNAYLVIIFVIFAPLYFMMQMTSLTEILFSLVLVLSVYLYFTDRFLLSAIVLSFLPLARTEGIILLPIFALAYLLQRKWWAVPLLGTGFLVYSFAGMSYYHDFLWLIHQNPYTGASDIYGSGSLLHFAEDTKFISGLPLAFLMLAGILVLGWQAVKSSRVDRRKALNIFWIIFMPYVVYFIFHSILWWKGMGGSLGLTRVIAAVLPLACMISFIGYNAVAKLLSFSRVAEIIFMLAVVFIIIRTTFAVNNVPVKLDSVEIVLKESADFVKTENKSGEMIYYYDPMECFLLELDPYDASKSRMLLFDGGLHMESLADNSLLIWDAHFGPNEGQVPIDTLLKQSHLKLLKVLRPDQPFTVLGGYNYEVYVFRRLPASAIAVNNQSILGELAAAAVAQNDFRTLADMNFESPVAGQDSLKLTQEAAHSGKSSYRLGSAEEYGPTASVLFSAMNPAAIYPMRIEATVYVYTKQKPLKNQAVLVISCENDGKPYIYQATELGTNIVVGNWTKLTTWVNVHESKSPNDNIKVYLWHLGKDELLVDDMKAEVIVKKAK